MYLKTGNLQQCHKNEKKRGGIKSTLLVKWAASAQNLCPQAHWANCPLLQFGNNSDYIVSFCRRKSEQAPSPLFIAPFSHRRTDIGCQLLKRASDCLSLSESVWLSSETTSPSIIPYVLCPCHASFFVRSLPSPLLLIIGCSQKTQSRWTQ